MNNIKKILKLLVRFLFYGHFAVWSFAAGIIIRTGNSGNYLQDNEAYLITSEYSFSLISGKEDADHKLRCLASYLNSSQVKLFELTGNHISKKSESSLIQTNKCIIRDYTRPPPFLS